MGPTALELSRRLRKSVVNFAQPGQLFEDLGITYVGPVPGHDLKALDFTLRRALYRLEGPVIVHVRTRKGRGYRPAEADAIGFHGAALPPMTVVPVTPSTAALTGACERRRRDPLQRRGRGRQEEAAQLHRGPRRGSSSKIGTEDPRVVAITAGMPTGTGLNRFAAAFPDRMYDVGIAEQHAVTFATGLALGGMRPFVALYSTFLQRAFDQTVHDVCQNDQPVVIGVDRAGLVGEDGTSHQGMFTIPAQRQLPNLVIASPKDEQELRRLLRTAFSQEHPFALHYPRDPGFDLPEVEAIPIPVGQGESLREGTDVLLVGFGPIVARAMEAADALARTAGRSAWSTLASSSRSTAT